MSTTATIAARFFIPALTNTRRKAVEASKELNKVLAITDVLQPDQRKLVDEALMHLADSVGCIDVLLEQLESEASNR